MVIRELSVATIGYLASIVLAPASGAAAEAAAPAALARLKVVVAVISTPVVSFVHGLQSACRYYLYIAPIEPVLGRRFSCHY